MYEFVIGSARPSATRAASLKLGTSAMALAVCLFVFLPICRAQSDDADNGVAPAAQTAAQPQSAEADSAGTPTQPGVRVVRLSDVEGAVQILRGDQTQFPQAVMNMPLAQGTTVKTGQDGRAEIEFEDGSVARITPNSVLKIEELQTSSDGAMTTAVGQLSGLIYYELRSDPKSPFSVTFGDTTVTPTVNSTFRVNLATTPQEVAVIDGRVQVQDSSHSYLAEVAQGKTIQFQASGNAKYTVANWVAPNGFDDWNDQRDQEAANEAKNQTPARVQEGGGSIMDSGLGWSDLDNSGGWYPLPGYGMVWQPYGAGPGFDPYGNGMWADFGGGFGYSWVSGYPWGWLPFHCGSWSYIGSFGWGWMPGAYGCGGYGFGFGGYYGYGRYGHRGHYWRTNVYRGPSGYRAPVPPATVKGQPVQRIVRVGNQQPGMRTASLQNKDANRGNGRATHVNNAARPVKFNGTKIAPLHSMMAGVRVPTRNAALYNNYPAHAFQGNVRTALLDHNASTGHGNAPGFARGASGATRPGSFNIARGRSVATHPFGGANRPALGSTNRAAFGNSNRATFGGANRATFGGAGRSAFSQRNSFGSHGSFGGAHSPPSAGGFRSGGGFHSGSMGHSGGGFHGGGVSAGGGFHGGGGGGFQGGGGGGFHGGGGAVGGGGHTAH